MPVALFVLPLFALANTCISINGDWHHTMIQSHALGIIAGLVMGKPIGIILFCVLSVSFGLSVIPKDLKWINILGAGFLAGIGFTMSIFITLLAFDATGFVNSSKLAVLLASVVAGIFGYVLLHVTLTLNGKG